MGDVPDGPDLERVTSLLDRALEGDGGTLVLEGPEAREQLAAARRLARERDMTIRRAKGIEEPYATVGQLLGVHHRLDGSQADAAASAVLTLVSGLARHAPVALLVDATSGVDRPSLRILAGVARRLPDRRIAIVIAIGDGPQPEALEELRRAGALLRPPPPPPPPPRA
jgi:hypothetical protein